MFLYYSNLLLQIRLFKDLLLSNVMINLKEHNKVTISIALIKVVCYQFLITTVGFELYIVSYIVTFLKPPS